MGPEGKKLLNIIVLGLGFMFMFTAFQTCGNIEQTIIKSFNSTEFHGSGYTSSTPVTEQTRTGKNDFRLPIPVVISNRPCYSRRSCPPIRGGSVPNELTPQPEARQ